MSMSKRSRSDRAAFKRSLTPRTALGTCRHLGTVSMTATSSERGKSTTCSGASRDSRGDKRLRHEASFLRLHRLDDTSVLQLCKLHCASYPCKILLCYNSLMRPLPLFTCMCHLLRLSRISTRLQRLHVLLRRSTQISLLFLLIDLPSSKFV